MEEAEKRDHRKKLGKELELFLLVNTVQAFLTYVVCDI